MHNGSFINNLSNDIKAVSSENNSAGGQHDDALAKQYRENKRAELPCRAQRGLPRTCKTPKLRMEETESLYG